MAKNKLTHTGLGMDLVRRLAEEGLRVFTTEQARELAPSVGLSNGYFSQALHHLTRAGWLIRLRGGLYTLSSSLPGVPAAHEFEVAMALADPAAISHWSALHYHHLTEQAPRKIFVLTTNKTSIPRQRGKKSTHQDGYPIGKAIYQFIQVKPERFFGTQKVWINEVRITITDPERTLIDGLCMPGYFGDFTEVLSAFEARGKDLDVQRIVDYALKMNASTAKRLGWVLEQQGVEQALLRPLLDLEVRGYRILDPSGPHKGPCHKRWMIQENLPGKIST